MVGEMRWRSSATWHVVHVDVRSRDKEMATTRSANCGHEARGLRCVEKVCRHLDC